MSQPYSQSGTVTCHNCRTEYITAYADMAVCPRCGAIHLRSGDKPKKKALTSHSLGNAAPLRFHIKRAKNRIALTWFERPSISLRIEPNQIGALLLLAILLPIAYLYVVLLPQAAVAYFTDNQLIIQIVSHAIVPVLIILLMIITQYRRIIITGTEIIYQNAATRSIALHLVNDVLVERDGKHNTERYNISLKTDDRDIQLLQVRGSAFADYLATRIKALAQLRIHQETARPDRTQPEPYLRSNLIYLQPDTLTVYANEKLSTFRWKTFQPTLKSLRPTTGWIIAIGIAVIAAQLLPQESRSITVTVILGIGAATVLYPVIRLWNKSRQTPNTIQVDSRELIAYSKNPIQPAVYLPTSTIQQLYTRRQSVETHDEEDNRYQYALMAITDDAPVSIEITRFNDLSTPKFIEQEIEAFLGIRNIPAAGEFQEHYTSNARQVNSTQAEESSSI